MRREGQDSCHLGDPPMLSGNPATQNTFPSPKFHNRGEILFRLGTTARRLGSALRIQSTSSIPVVAWGQLCKRTYRGAPKPRPKPAVMLVGIPTHLSVMHWPTSRSERFGRKIQHQILRLRAAAVSGWRSAISAVTAIGRAMLSLRLLQKFSVVTPCATSRSFPNGSHRPF